MKRLLSQTKKIMYVCKIIYRQEMKERLLKYRIFAQKHLSLVKILALTFIIIMIFVDDNSLLQSFAYNRKIRQLKGDIEHYQHVIDESNRRLNELRSNSENLEKFAREQYLMKKPNEDIYIIEVEKNNNE